MSTELEIHSHVSPKHLSWLPFSRFQYSSSTLLWIFPIEKNYFVLWSGIQVDKKTESAVFTTCLDLWFLHSSTLPAAFFHQGVNRNFIVKGTQFPSKNHEGWPFYRICSTDWRKGVKFRMLLRSLRIPARPPRKTCSTSSIKVSIETSQFLQKFRIETSVFENSPSESWCSEK